ncbi:S66 peptidase family protein [Naasia lichenicola]|uniref:LD-carboxypeptidase n=1 Tax=Naasia lichenicola TaxID=2565933 RepID=A0A4S4FMD7_9MICO|nr:S66 peptidase family protein [Naasia lichenicola]THG31569.1 LD-carboxypeptidase [Naasia lichenicola]
MQLLRPPAVRPGDVVAVAALSGGLDADEAEIATAGIAALESLGFTVRTAPLVELGRGNWWSAGTPREIAADLNALLADREVRAIFALTGGRTTFSYLDLVDLDAVRSDPKPLLGFSDITALQLALHAKTGLVTVHSDLVTHGLGYWHELEDDRRDALAAALLAVLDGTAPHALPTSGSWETWRSGTADGPLVGGLLNRLVKLQATPFALPPERFDGAILFWEDVSASTSSVWNDLHVLRLGGHLDRIAGMIVGPTSTIEETDGGPDLRAVVLDVLGDREIPVLGNVEIGHNPPNLPLPLGIRARLDSSAPSLTLLEPAVVS